MSGTVVSGTVVAVRRSFFAGGPVPADDAVVTSRPDVHLALLPQ